MKKFLILRVTFIAISIEILPASAETIDVSRAYPEMIGQHFRIYRSDDIHISMDDALNALRNGYFTQPAIPGNPPCSVTCCLRLPGWIKQMLIFC